MAAVQAARIRAVRVLYGGRRVILSGAQGILAAGQPLGMPQACPDPFPAWS
jgi:hypothetical protein